MKILCRLGWHEADCGEVYSGGYYFSACIRCRRDMIRLGGAWQLIPEGHKVAWRKERPAFSMGSAVGDILPVLVAECRLPDLQSVAGAAAIDRNGRGRAVHSGRIEYGRA